MQPDERLEVRAAHQFVVETAQASEVVETRGALEYGGIVHHDGAAFARCDGLVQLQAVDADVADGADWSPFVARADALSAILEHFHVVFAGNGQNAVEIGRVALQVHRHDQLRLRSNPALDVVRIDVERLVDFGEHGQRAGEHNGRVAGVPGPGRQNHLVAGADFERIDGGLERRGTGGDGQREAGPHARGELLLEGGHLHRGLLAAAVPAERPAGFEHLDDLLTFLFVVIFRDPRNRVSEAFRAPASRLRRRVHWLLRHGKRWRRPRERKLYDSC